jgi:hypothetical protein
MTSSCATWRTCWEAHRLLLLRRRGSCKGGRPGCLGEGSCAVAARLSACSWASGHGGGRSGARGGWGRGGGRGPLGCLHAWRSTAGAYRTALFCVSRMRHTGPWLLACRPDHPSEPIQNVHPLNGGAVHRPGPAPLPFTSAFIPLSWGHTPSTQPCTSAAPALQVVAEPAPTGAAAGGQPQDDSAAEPDGPVVKQVGSWGGLARRRLQRGG